MDQVIVGVDGSAGAERALAWAVDAARARRAAVRVVHAWELITTVNAQVFAAPDRARREAAAHAVLDRAVREVEEDGLPVPIEPVLVPGTAAGALLQQAAAADLVVVGSRGRGGFAGLVLGSVSHQLVEHSPCPVVVVPEGWDVTATERVVVGVDGSDGARAALRWALDWAAPERAEVEVVTAFESDLGWIDGRTDYEQEWVARERASAEAALRHVVDEVAPGGGRELLPPVVEEGAPAQVLLDRAKDADLLVVGTRGRGGFAGLLLGSVSQRCTEHALCPVAVIPPSR